MRRSVALVIALTGCGRIGIDPVPASGGSANDRDSGGSPGDAALVVDDSGTALGCGFIQCDAGSTACCVDGRTSCAPDTMCGGATYQCGSCPKFSACCDLGSSGTVCSGNCP